MDYTELTNRLYNSYEAETLCADAAQAIEALQARVTNLSDMHSALAEAHSNTLKEIDKLQALADSRKDTAHRLKASGYQKELAEARTALRSKT